MQGKGGIAVALAAAITATAAAAVGDLGQEKDPPMPLTLHFLRILSAGHYTPSRYTCEGKDISPPLSWADVPEGHCRKPLALIVDDPDAPDPQAPRMTWVHWVLYNLPPTTRALPEGMRYRGAARRHEGRARTTGNELVTAVRVHP